MSHKSIHYINILYKSGLFIFIRLEVAVEWQCLCVRIIVSVAALCVVVQLLQRRRANVIGFS